MKFYFAAACLVKVHIMESFLKKILKLSCNFRTTRAKSFNQLSHLRHKTDWWNIYYKEPLCRSFGKLTQKRRFLFVILFSFGLMYQCLDGAIPSNKCFNSRSFLSDESPFISCQISAINDWIFQINWQILDIVWMTWHGSDFFLNRLILK